jgi:hypothetical protein
MGILPFMCQSGNRDRNIFHFSIVISHLPFIAYCSCDFADRSEFPADRTIQVTRSNAKLIGDKWKMLSPLAHKLRIDFIKAGADKVSRLRKTLFGHAS